MPKTITNETDASVKDFVNSIPDLAKREDCRTLVDVFSSATNKEPKMWGAHIVGYGKHHYSLASGAPGEICRVGFAPRAKSFSLYLADFPESELLYSALGKHKFSGGCLHIARLADINLDILNKIVKAAYAHRSDIV